MMKQILKYGIPGLVCVVLGTLIFCDLTDVRSSGENVSPEILMDSDIIEASIEDEEAVLLTGVKAQDAEDGDISDQVRISSIQKIDDNDFRINYIVFDSENYGSENSRALKYTDYYSPRIEILKPLEFVIDGKEKLSDFVSATDCVDGDISGFVHLDGLSTDVSEGKYDCTLSVTNHFGDTRILPVTVKFVEKEEKDECQLILRSYVTYLEKGEKFIPDDYLDYVIDNGKVEIDFGYRKYIEQNGQASGSWVNIDCISCETNLDQNTPGIYQAVYTYISEESKEEVSAELLIVVE
ncbi:hypothetical protein [Anaerostipes sp.]|uniref:hypothetical protein n=1 Tax=Anaerostipes sp. TaxID=1872530 RepID=UPI00258696B3|nr:hypothetical protein [Anaerostipes sp.]MCI5623936.1 hypothetical protein [Anaerostipes sp.]